MSYKIEKNHEFPTKRRNKFPFDQMEIGDSFLVPNSEFTDSSNVRQNIYNAATAYKAKQPDFKCSVKLVDDGMRVWRVK
jgi:hypothetical protein